jgi:LPXTG-motif cell wall-anchored protein
MTRTRRSASLLALIALLLAALTPMTALADGVDPDDPDDPAQHCPDHQSSTKVETSSGSHTMGDVTLTWGSRSVTITNDGAEAVVVDWCAKGGNGFAGGSGQTSQSIGRQSTTVEPGGTVTSGPFGTGISYLVVYGATPDEPGDDPTPCPWDDTKLADDDDCVEPGGGPEEVTPSVSFTGPSCDAPEAASITKAHEGKITYTVEGTPAPGSTVTVTAAPKDGYTFPDGFEPDWDAPYTFGTIDLEVDCPGNGGERPEQVTPAVPGFAGPICEALDRAEVIAEDTAEYTYSISGDVAVGETVTVTATPREGFVFDEGVATEWTYAFAAVDETTCVEVEDEQLVACPWVDGLLMDEEGCVEPREADDDQRTREDDPALEQERTTEVVETAVLGVTLQQATDDDEAVADELADTGASSLLTLVLAGLVSLGLGGVMLRRRDETA